MEKYIDDFFLEELKKEGFNRYDIIVRLLAIEEYMKQSGNGLCLYEKMQYYRLIEKPYIIKDGNRDYCNKFISLIRNFLKNGYVKENNAILLNKYGNLIDGSHRIALALYFGYDYVRCDYSKDLQEFNDQIKYGKDWFEKYFTNEEVNIIYERYKKLLVKRGRILYAVIWPLGFKYLSVIEEMINEYFEVISYKDIMFDSFSEIKLFGELIYAQDSYRENRVSEKIDTFVECKKKYAIRIYKLKYYQNEYVDEIDKKLDYIVYAKEKIRTNLKKSIIEYFYDNIFHCGQTISENQFLQLLYETNRSVPEVLFK